MQLWSSHRLLLKHEPGAKLHLSANAEGVDALVTRSLPRSRTKDLPLIRFTSLVDRLLRLPGRGESQQVESSIAIDVGDVKYPRGTHGLSQRGKFLRAIAQPHHRASRVPGIRRDRSEQQIDRSVVIQIGGVQAHF